jgi:hypothetical protein
MIPLSHNKESASHENDQPQKEILSYFEPDSLDWVTGEIGAPPFDVSGVAYLLHGMASFDKRHQLESTRRTLESMVAGGLLERVTVYESRQVKRAAVKLAQRSCATVYPVSVLLCAILAALITQYQANTCGSVKSLQSVVNVVQVVNPAFNIQHQEIVDLGLFRIIRFSGL